MIYHLDHLIKEHKSLDYYIILYPKLVTAFYTCKHEHAYMLYSMNIITHIQLVIEEHNDDLLFMNSYLRKDKYNYRCI